MPFLYCLISDNEHGAKKCYCQREFGVERFVMLSKTPWTTLVNSRALLTSKSRCSAARNRQDKQARLRVLRHKTRMLVAGRLPRPMRLRSIQRLPVRRSIRLLPRERLKRH